MRAVLRISPHLQDVRVPEPLRDLPYWLMYRLEQFAGEAKARKIPYWADGGRRHGEQGSPFDLDKLTTFAVAQREAIRKGFDGVGFAHVAGADVITLDFDNCVTDGVVRQDVLDLVSSTYAEYSPSGNGIHAIFTGKPELLLNQKHKGEDGDFSVEAFSSAGFTTFTGWMLDHIDLLGYEDKIAPIPEAVVAACRSRFGSSNSTFDPDDFMAGREPRLGLSVEEMQTYLNYLDPGMGRDPWLRVGMALHHETEGDDTGFELWDEWSQGGHNYPSTEALRAQWDSFKPAPGKRQVTMASVIKMAKDAGYRASETTSPEQILAKVEEILEERGGGRFTSRFAYEMASQEPIEWLIKGVVPKAELIILYGASGAGKTFVALDHAFAIARGVDWRGRRVKQGIVVIIAAEGGKGVAQRLQAYAQYHGIDLRDVPNLRIITAAPNFLESDDIAEVIAELQSIGDVSCVMVDTLAQVTPGANENTSEDMGRALSNVRLIHRATDATVYGVHHAGKDLNRGSRGWSGLKAAADAQIEVLRHEDGSREIHIEKMKDGEDGMRWAFKLEVVDLGVDYDGDPVTSCVAIETDLPARKPDEDDRRGIKRRGRVENHILEVMTLFGSESVVKAEELIVKAIETMPPPEDGKRDTRRQSIVRALNGLSREKDGPLKVEGGIIIFYE
jgi:hypothetical protein